MVENDSLIAKADNEFAGIEFAMKSEAPLELVIEHMGRKVNTRYSEFAPAEHPGGDLYIGALPASELQVLTDAPFAQIFKTTLDKNEKWEKPKSLPDKINRPGYHLPIRVSLEMAIPCISRGPLWRATTLLRVRYLSLIHI